MATYTVQKGDTLSKIAKTYGTTVAALASSNGIKDADVIGEGASITVPDIAAAAASTASTATATTGSAAATTTPDADLQAQAEALYNPEYEATVNALTANEQALTTQYDRELADYSQYIDQKLADTQLSVENSLLKRGMGRSTRAAYEVTQGLADVNAESQENVAELTADYNTNLADLATQKTTLAATKAQNVAAKLLELKQWQESVRQFNAELALSEKELALAYGSSGSGGSSSSSTGFVDLRDTDTTGAAASTTQTGFVGGVLYSGGTPFTGTFGGAQYVNGKKQATKTTAGNTTGVTYSSGTKKVVQAK